MRRRRNRLHNKTRKGSKPKSVKAFKHVLAREVERNNASLIAKALQNIQINGSSAQTEGSVEAQKNLRKHLQQKAVSAAATNYVPESVRKAFKEAQNATENRTPVQKKLDE